jgi:hypothetical protein
MLKVKKTTFSFMVFDYAACLFPAFLTGAIHRVLVHSSFNTMPSYSPMPDVAEFLRCFKQESSHE